jgi:transcriptional regulator with XRE-family HTH domain
MALSAFATPDELQRELGQRLRRLRLARNADQRALADKAGISEKALRNLESGHGSSIETLVRVLKALNLVECIEMLAPTPTVSPTALAKSLKTPQRASHPRGFRRNGEA